jgi:HK97 family phage portal protein
VRLFGFEITFGKAQTLPENVTQSPRSNWLAWWGPIKESYTGAWQQNVTVCNPANLMTFSALYATVTGIATDISKMRIKLDRIEGGIWEEIDTPSPFAPVLRKPNHYQNRIQFIQQWIVSKLIAGNAYVLKQRDARGIVTALYVLDPRRVQTLVTDDGGVYYQLQTDYLSEIAEPITVPASEMIHDMMVALWHPLVGVSPIYACSISATMGNKIQENSTTLFTNRTMPGGILSAPGHIADDTALRLKNAFEANFGGANIGRIAVLGDGLTFEPMMLTMEASQAVEQLKWTVEDVGRAFHYPAYKLGGDFPPYASGPEALTMMYYTDCLQGLIEELELCLDEGLGLPQDMGTELDLDNLMRMDTGALYESNNKGVTGGWLEPDEARFRANYRAVAGGNTPYMQQQNYSLAALAKRDAQADPFAKNPATPPPDTPPPQPPQPPPPAKAETDWLWTDADLEALENELKTMVHL